MWRSAELSIDASTSQCETGTWSPPESSTTFGVTLPRLGAFHRRTNGQEHIVDRTTGYFSRVGEVSEVAHFEDRIHGSTTIDVDPEHGVSTLAEIQQARGPFVVGPDLAAAHHLLLSALERSAIDDLEVQERTYELLGACITRAHPGFRGSTRRKSSSERRRLVVDVCEHLNTSDRISLVDIAARVHYSPFHLTRVFRSMTGITMSQYRTNLKLHDVLARLVDGDTNLSDIAVSAGFIDHSHMTRTFVANVGATPSELRQLLRGGRAAGSRRSSRRGWAPLPSETGMSPYLLVWR
jgi:AraC-like DNA-binding protein